LRQGDHGISVDYAQLGKAAGNSRHGDSLSDQQTFDALTKFGDHTGRFEARNERWLWFELVQALDYEKIGKIQACGMHLDKYLTRGWNRILNLGNCQVLV
jgi:hypothetical protein